MWYVVLTVKDDIFRSDFLRSFMQFQHHNIASEHVFIPEINSHCILSQMYALFIEFYYALFFKDMHYNTMLHTFCILKKNDVQCFSLPDFLGPL